MITLKPQDLLVALKLWVVTKRVKVPTYPSLGEALGMSPSEVHAAVKRLAAAGFLLEPKLGRPSAKALKEFLFHGLKYVFIPEQKGQARGVETGWSASPVRTHFSEEVRGYGQPFVWPWPDGNCFGRSVDPLYRSAPQAALGDEELYELLVLLDVLRLEGARDREIARGFLEERLR